jgi:hypothetical protein
MCPAAALRRLFYIHSVDVNTADTSPLLQMSNGEPLSYRHFSTRLESILPQLGVSGHSFHRGGATWAFQQGLQSEIIQELGFWKSDAYLRYLESSLDQKFGKMYQFGSSLPLTL